MHLHKLLSVCHASNEATLQFIIWIFGILREYLDSKHTDVAYSNGMEKHQISWYMYLSEIP